MDIQATAVSYKKHAILLQGVPGVGKTSLALQLVESGAVLLGDDVVEIFLKNNQLYCKCKEKLKGIIEVRGLGLVKGLPIAKAAPVLCVIRLHKRPTQRLPIPKTTSLLNKKIPVFDFYACNTTKISVLYTIRTLTGSLRLLKENIND